MRISVCLDRLGQASQPAEDHGTFREPEHPISWVQRTPCRWPRIYRRHPVNARSWFSYDQGFFVAGNMLVAYWTADHEALSSIVSDAGKFFGADSYTFLSASLMILIFGPSYFAMDPFIAKRSKETA